MWQVYVLYSHKDKKLYVGCTNALNERINRHKGGYVPATKHRRPLSLIHSENIESKTKAFQRERFLKSLWGSRFKKSILLEYQKKLENNG